MRRRTDAGITLVELMVALTIAMIAVLGGATVFKRMAGQTKAYTARVAAMDAIELLTQSVTKDFSTLIFNPVTFGASCPSGTNCAFALTNAASVAYATTCAAAPAAFSKTAFAVAGGCLSCPVGQRPVLNINRIGTPLPSQRFPTTGSTNSTTQPIAVLACFRTYGPPQPSTGLSMSVTVFIPTTEGAVAPYTRELLFPANSVAGGGVQISQ